MILYNDWLLHSRVSKTGKLHMQKKRLPDNACPELKAFQKALFNKQGKTTEGIIWLMAEYNWKLKEAVIYFKKVTGITSFSERWCKN